MTYLTHMVGGLVFGGVAVIATGNMGLEENLIAIAAGAELGSLLPDLDHPKSKISQTNLAASVASHATSIVTKHRGVLHTPLFIIAVLVLIATVAAVITLPSGLVVYLNPFTIGLAAGMLSHLVLDTFNPGGIMWAYPFKKKHYSIAKIKTRSLTEYVITGLMVVILCVMMRTIL